jgi:hypothetical protein
VTGETQPAFTYVVDPDDLAPELRAIRDYWDAKRGTRPMPRRKDVDPLELAAHLPYLSLVDVLRGGADFRFRLLGTGITGQFGRDSTGKTMSEVYATADPEVLNWIVDSFAMVVTSKRPVLMRGLLRVVDKDFVKFESFHLPLSEDGDEVSMFLGRTRFIERT